MSIDTAKWPFYVYYYENKVNGKMYIGKGRKRRYMMHVLVAETKGSGEKYGTQYKHLHKSINRHGLENFEYGIFAYYDSEDEAYEAEEFWIRYLLEQGITLYNTAIGGRRGQSGVKRSEETKQRMSKARKGKPTAWKGGKHTEEAKQRMSKSAMGKAGTNNGKKFSEETKSRMSTSLLGKSNVKARRFTEEQEKEICRLYDVEKKELHELRRAYECYSNVISGVLERNNIQKRASRQSVQSNGCNKFTKEEEKTICDDFIANKGGLAALGRKFDCSNDIVRRILKANNIDMKTRRYK